MERDPFRHKENAARVIPPDFHNCVQTPESRGKASGLAYCTCTVRTRIQKKTCNPPSSLT